MDKQRLGVWTMEHEGNGYVVQKADDSHARLFVEDVLDALELLALVSLILADIEQNRG